MTAKPTQGVLDLCFIEAKTSEDITNYLIEIEKEREKKLEMEAQQQFLETENHASADGNNMTGTQGGEMILSSPKTRKRNEKESYKAIRIGNNHIDVIDTIFCLNSYVNFENILWIDLSFNELSKVWYLYEYLDEYMHICMYVC